MRTGEASRLPASFLKMASEKSCLLKSLDDGQIQKMEAVSLTLSLDIYLHTHTYIIHSYIHTYIHTYNSIYLDKGSRRELWERAC